MTGGNDLRLDAVREIYRLARDDRRRGIDHWFDPQLAADLRDLVKEIDVRPRGSKPSEPQSVPLGSPPEKSGPQAAGTGRKAAVRPVWGPPPEPEGRDADWEEQLRAVEEEAKACTACGLHRTRTNVVFNSGTGRIPLVFVGEAPGADEDARGEAFVGRAGQLLTRIIEAIGLPRKDVYICNVLKCRPPQNRNPAQDEIALCRPYLERQLRILKPKVICTLGLFATQLLLDSTMPIGKLRGRVMEKDGWKILPTYHPAALLRNPNLKSTVWEDVQLLRRILDT